MKSNNFYEVLEIIPVTIAQDIKRAYKKLAQEFHPKNATFP